MRFGWIVALMLFVSLASNFCRAGARADFIAMSISPEKIP